jgi:hypothetical protein
LVFLCIVFSGVCCSSLIVFSNHTCCSLQEMARLLAAKAKLRVVRSSYRPCQYDIADICNSLLSSGLPKLATSHLSSGESSGRGRGMLHLVAFVTAASSQPGWPLKTK